MKKSEEVKKEIGKKIQEVEKLIAVTKNGLAGECPESELKKWEKDGWSQH